MLAPSRSSGSWFCVGFSLGLWWAQDNDGPCGYRTCAPRQFSPVCWLVASCCGVSWLTGWLLNAASCLGASSLVGWTSLVSRPSGSPLLACSFRLALSRLAARSSSALCLSCWRAPVLAALFSQLILSVVTDQKIPKKKFKNKKPIKKISSFLEFGITIARPTCYFPSTSALLFRFSIGGTFDECFSSASHISGWVLFLSLPARASVLPGSGCLDPFSWHFQFAAGFSLLTHGMFVCLRFPASSSDALSSSVRIRPGTLFSQHD